MAHPAQRRLGRSWSRSHDRYRSWFLSVAVAAVLAGLLATVGACGDEAPAGGGQPPAERTGDRSEEAGERDQDPAEARADEAAEWASARLAEMTLEEKVGQLFVTYVYGESADTRQADAVARNEERLGVANGREAVERYHLGGVIYFEWAGNLADPAQVAELSADLQRAALGQPPEVPLLISVDQEHGTVLNLGAPATRLPGAMALGAAGRAADAREAAGVAGRELRAVGIAMNHAPVADVNVNPANPVIGVRSFSSDPDLAARLAAAQVTGYQPHVATSVKHFPGHGDTDVDSHTGLPTVTHTVKEWQETDAPPFRSAIEAGAGAVMVGHLRFPALDPSGDPATLSEPIVTGLLREDLGYDGVVITDSLEMAGVRQTYADAEVPVRALKAGVDLLLMPPDLDEAYRAVLDAVRSGELTEERIDASVRRVLTLKHTQGVVDAPFPDPSRATEVVGAEDHQAAAQRIADATTTLVRNDDDLLPLSPDGQRVLVTGASQATVDFLAERIRARDGTAGVTSLPSATTTQAEAVAAARGHDVIVVTTSGTGDHPGQVALLDALIATGLPVVAVATGVPYDLADYPDAATTQLATYSAVPVSLEAAVRVLLGETDPVGTLPVDVPGAFPLGHGLEFP